jgi:hypothetical protein
VVRTLEEIVYDAGRGAPADQDALVAGIRQRTGTLLAAHALVASFLGAATIRETGLQAWGWLVISLLVVGLTSAGVLLAPWRLTFAVDAREPGYQSLREKNAARVSWMSRLSASSACSWSSRHSLGWLAWR